jgi:hypothetical protein
VQSDNATEPYLISGVQENFTSHTPLKVQGGMWSPYGGHIVHIMASEHHMVATSWNMGILCSKRLQSFRAQNKAPGPSPRTFHFGRGTTSTVTKQSRQEASQSQPATMTTAPDHRHLLYGCVGR